MVENLTLRAARPEDTPFLLAVYASIRSGELAVTPWTDAEKAAFVQIQFAAQDHQYRQNFPAASFDVIQLGDQPIGRLYVARCEHELRIVDIALMPAHCNRGLGTSLLRALQAEASATGKPLRIHVERFNPALRLYQRLGFRQIVDRGVYLFLEWRQDASG